MEIVINIPEEDYKAIRKTNVILGGQRSGKTLMSAIYNAVSKGTPLPKRHGRIIDENELKKEAIRCEWSRNMYDTLDHTLSYMKPIIGADKEN